MTSRPWKEEERRVARLLGGTRYPANSGGRVDVEGPTVVAQVKHVRRLSLAQLEALALEMQAIGSKKGKAGLVVVKRRAGGGHTTPRLVVMTEEGWRAGHPRGRSPKGKAKAPSFKCARGYRCCEISG